VLRPELLDRRHDTSAFTCGEPSLDDWLRAEGLAAQQKGTARVFVVVDKGDPDLRVLAYYTLSPHVLQREELSRRLGRGMPDQLPAVLLGKLAVDVSRQGSGFGSQVLAEAIARVTRLCDQLGFRHLVVDVVHEQAASFYEHFGFVRIPTQQSLRLVLRVRADLLHF
jgi:GNAT superfamily N-acetyltransferase